MDKAEKVKTADFFEKEKPRLVRFIRDRIAEDSSRDAEDILQDVMLKVFGLADINAPIENLASYIYAAIRNRIIDAFRAKRPQLSFDELEDAEAAGLENLIYNMKNESAADYGEVYEAIGRLEESERAILIATEFEGFSFRELAKEWNEPVGTLLSRKKRALDKIKNILIKGGVKNG